MKNLTRPEKMLLVVICILLVNMFAAMRRPSVKVVVEQTKTGREEFEIDVDKNGVPDRVTVSNGRFALVELNGEPAVRLRSTKE